MPTGAPPGSESARMTFARIAENYDRFNALASLGIHRRWLKRLVRDVCLEEPQRILDVAGGTGAVSMALSRALPDAEITLSDLSPEMLAVAEQRLSAERAKYAEKNGPGTKSNYPRFDNIKTVVADAHNLPFPDNSYDVVTCAYGIRNMTDRPRALAEIFRVLKPDRVLIVLEFSTPVALVWRKLYHLYLRLVIPTLGGLLTGNRSEFEYLRESILAFPPQQAFSEMLREIGFGVYHYDLTGGIVALHNATKEV